MQITPLFPSCDADAARSPLVKGPYDAALHLAIGNLKQADATKNGVPGTLPFTDFFAPSGEIIQGANMLDVHGPMFFAIVREVLPKLLPELGEAFCAAKNANDINDVMLRHVQWCASRCIQLIIAYATGDTPQQDDPLITEGQEIIPHGLAAV